jgi:hypothetical protein
MKRSQRLLGLLAISAVTAAAMSPLHAEKRHAKRSISDQAVEINPFGRPKGVGGPRKHPALFIWCDQKGWHVRSEVGGERRHHFRGYVVVKGGNVTGLGGANMLEHHGPGIKVGRPVDGVVLNGDQNRIDFKLVTEKKGEDGFDFTVSRRADILDFGVWLDGADHPRVVHIGPAGQHPADPEFRLPAHRAPSE